METRCLALLFIFPFGNGTGLLAGCESLPHALVQALHVTRVRLAIEQRALVAPEPNLGTDRPQTA